MQSSSTSKTTGTTELGSGYAPFVGSSAGTTSGTSTNTAGRNNVGSAAAGYAAGIEQRVKEMGAGAERVVTNQAISEQQARQPVKEYTEFVEKPKIQQPTEYSTQQRVMEKEEAPIKLKQQEVQQVEKKTVVQEQPVIVRKQEVQLEKEAPIQVTKHTTEHQTLPAIEKKELYVQPVEHTPGQERVLSTTTKEAGMSVEYNLKGEAKTVEAIEPGRTEQHGVKAHFKETMGGVKDAAHGVMDKVREVFHPSGSTSTSDQSRRETPST